MLFSLKAQPYDSKGIVLAGGTYLDVTHVLDWSMGIQVSVQPYVYTNHALFTTGNLQGNPSLVSNSKMLYDPPVHLIITPQPAQHFIYLRLNQPEVVIQEIRIFNTESTLVFQKKGPFAGIILNEQINIDTFTPGIFFLLIDYTIESEMRRQKIFKILKT